MSSIRRVPPGRSAASDRLAHDVVACDVTWFGDVTHHRVVPRYLPLSLAARFFASTTSLVSELLYCLHSLAR